ncbi:MAG: glycosyltransferase [Planctomycetes bacterium]|nr:glycosyltransferase [Planctomycetota bacterium]
MTVCFVMGVISASLYLVILFTKVALSRRYFARHPEVESLDGTATILQPILGGDPFLQDVLEANLRNVAPGALFVWLVDEDDVAGRAVTELLAQAEPDRIRLILCPACPIGTNPKLFKLNIAIPHVTTEFVAVLDDDTMLSPQHLPRAMATLTKCDLYTGLPRYLSGGNVWSDLVAHFVNNNSIVTYLSLLDWTGPLTINGMFYVMRTDYLRALGGFESIQNQLCDDYALARRVLRQGGRLRQGVTSQLLRTSIAGPRHYLRQMHRWFLFANVLVLDQSMPVQCLLVVLLGLPPLLLWGSFLMLSGGWGGLLLLIALFTIRHVTLRLLQRRVFGEPQRFSPGLSLVAELLQVVHLVHAGVSPVIVWRSRWIRVGRGGAFTSLSELPS